MESREWRVESGEEGERADDHGMLTVGVCMSQVELIKQLREIRIPLT